VALSLYFLIMSPTISFCDAVVRDDSSLSARDKRRFSGFGLITTEMMIFFVSHHFIPAVRYIFIVMIFWFYISFILLFACPTGYHHIPLYDETLALDEYYVPAAIGKEDSQFRDDEVPVRIVSNDCHCHPARWRIRGIVNCNAAWSTY